jgi:hypothetical protein
MPSAAVEFAFQARLFEATSGNPPVIPAIVSGEPPKNGIDAFVIVQYPVVNGSKPVIGRHYLEDGAARVVLNVRRTLEMADALGMADTIAGIFRDLKFHGIQSFTPSPPIINDAGNDGNWFSLSVIVPYRYQFDD